jgi:hypothetical protein
MPFRSQSPQPFLMGESFMTIENYVFRCRLGLLLLLCLFALGCSQNVKVTGTVTYSDTGEPVKFGLVTFTGDQEIGRGTIKDGKYAVGLINDGDGIPKGTYTVSSDAFPPPNYGLTDMFGNVSQSASSDQEIYYTEEPQTIEINKSMTYDFTVERGVRPRK